MQQTMGQSKKKADDEAEATSYSLAEFARKGKSNPIRFSGDMCGGKTPSGWRDASPSHRPSGAKPRAMECEYQNESPPRCGGLSFWAR